MCLTVAKDIFLSNPINKQNFLKQLADLASLLEEVLDQGRPTEVPVPHHLVFGVLRADGAQPLAIRPRVRVVEVADHLISLNLGWVHRPIAGLRLKLVETALHVSDRRPAWHILAARDTSDLSSSLLVLLIA